MKVISVFGGSHPRPGEPDFETAYQLGRLLAQAGYAVATGGYVGTMTAVSQGAAEAGGHVIGVTCDEIESWRPVKPNRWVQEEIRYPTLWERLNHLVVNNGGAIALPGGVGTLTEVALTWNQMLVDAIPLRPLILLGAVWQRTLEAFIIPEYVPPRFQALVQLASTPEGAVELLNEHPAGLIDSQSGG